ncbi:Protein FAR1-RELATED SEQUENCE like [Actinidia chinensis var. chinensis]|uniref:Protein FAR1-RELATED SEQUENCE like n=1 Tax=Actinidia chinensis var. chinensis TaxID=1590841 RepID=A0A2R6Q4A5_ACTCC|nr:Protein FAR1-RELATED SEQUENCE like [Actinidia chinensis var. chinensis]
MEGDAVLYLQLHKLSGVKSQEDLQHILTTLWRTRKTGLSPPDKSSIHSLLSLQSPAELDPVLACLRSLMRKFVHQNFTSDDILKLFPPDLSLDLQSILILLFQKYQNQWKEEISREQHLLPRTRVSHQVNTDLEPTFTSFPSSEILASLWPRQDEPFNRFVRNDFGASTPLTADTNVSHMASISLQRDVCPADNLGILPRLKSMTWTLENRKKGQTNRVAVISLKLQDYTKSPSGEMEVKFQLTRDTLEAMLRSMTYISEQLSNLVGSSTGPLQKKQRQ